MLTFLILFITISQTPGSFAGASIGEGGDGSFLELADRNKYIMGHGDQVVVTVQGGTSQYLISSGLSSYGIYAVGSDGYLAVSGIGARA